MADQKSKSFAGPIAIFVFVALITGLVMVNNWIQKKAGDIASHSVETPVVKPAVSPSQEPAALPKKRKGEVIRKTRFSPDRKYKINVFYQGGEEIARHKVSGKTIYDASGEIPDGRVKFINELNKTYGAEFYRDGELHGPARIYYSEGQLNRDVYYQYGKLMTSTEYYSDGTVRMKEDYYDARDYKDESETGIGKVYFRDGTIKYEWHLTDSDSIGFKKSYNRKGELVDEVYFDEYGQIIPPENSPSGIGVLSEIGAFSK